MIGDIDWEARGESVIKPIGPLAGIIDRMSFQDFAWLMIGLAKKADEVTITT